MKKIVCLIVAVLLFSCRSEYKIYSKPRPNPNQKDKYSEYCHYCLFVILDKSLAGNQVFIAQSKNTKYSLFPDNKQFSDTVYYNKSAPKKMENECEDIIKVGNFRAVDIFVNQDSVLVRDFTFPSYRFVVVTKKKKSKKPTYTFTNNISNYPKVAEKLNIEIPEIKLIEE